ncbi:unnamed protein product [Rhizoctonia solani]|uniref:Uncharacterized protein n=1 Tax=Rhizoctonia solani TaxID=456999 RepID=A0A8H3E1F2_9AGAM|nr:unnamed protein product [Rhizoctonia solani]
MISLTIWAGYLTDARMFNQWCITRETTDPFFLKCRKDCFGYNQEAVEIYAKRMKLPWRKKVIIDSLPFPGDSLGEVDATRKHTIFAFRNYDVTTTALNRFSSWHKYQETDKDREFKAQIEELLGFELGPWTIVSGVGHQGLFYNFSPETIPLICELMRQRAQMKRSMVAATKEEEEGVLVGVAERATD